MVHGNDRDVIDLDEVKDRYNKIDKIWDYSDKWHEYTRRNITKFLMKEIQNQKKDGFRKVLNAGSGGNDYGLTNLHHVHVDIADMKMREIPNSLVAPINNIPLESESFDLCMCVGSVLNYCDAVASIRELQRLLKLSGILVLEFESSCCYEFLFRKSFGSSASLEETFYQGKKEKIWVFSESYIRKILSANGLRVTRVHRFHLLSPLLYRITKDSDLATEIAWTDHIVRLIPILRKYSSNVILSCVKTG